MVPPLKCNQVYLNNKGTAAVAALGVGRGAADAAAVACSVLYDACAPHTIAYHRVQLASMNISYRRVAGLWEISVAPC